MLVRAHHPIQFVCEILGGIFVPSGINIKLAALFVHLYPVAGLPAPVVHKHIVAPLALAVIETGRAEQLLLLLDALAGAICLADGVHIIEAEVFFAVLIRFEPEPGLLPGGKLPNPYSRIGAVAGIQRPAHGGSPHYARSSGQSTLMQFREIRMVANVVTMGMAGKNDHVVIEGGHQVGQALHLFTGHQKSA